MTQWGLDTIFNPAKRHMDDEKRRLQSTREEVGDNSGGKRIDFDSGKVRIPGAADGADAQTATDADADDPAIETDDAGDEEAAAGRSAAGKSVVGKGAAGSAAAGRGAAGRSAAGRSTEGAGAEPTAAQLRAAARRGRKLG